MRVFVFMSLVFFHILSCGGEGNNSRESETDSDPDADVVSDGDEDRSDDSDVDAGEIYDSEGDTETIDADPDITGCQPSMLDDVQLFDTGRRGSYDLTLVPHTDGLGAIWIRSADDGDSVLYVRVTETGERVGKNVVLDDTWRTSLSDPDMAWSGSQYGAVWGWSNPGVSSIIYFTLIDELGEQVDDPTSIDNGMIPMSVVRYPEIQWNGTNFGIVWSSSPYDPDADPLCGTIKFAVMNADGVQTLSNITIMDSTNPQPIDRSFIWTGSEYALFWLSCLDQIYFGRFDEFGRMIGVPVVIAKQRGSSAPRVNWNGEEFAVVWNVSGDDGERAYLAILTNSGSILSGPTEVASSPESYTSPSIVWNGEEYALTWSSGDRTENYRYLCRMSSDGVRLSGGDHLSDISQGLESELYWLGDKYLALMGVYEDKWRIYSALIGRCWD